MGSHLLNKVSRAISRAISKAINHQPVSSPATHSKATSLPGTRRQRPSKVIRLKLSRGSRTRSLRTSSRSSSPEPRREGVSMIRVYKRRCTTS